MTGGLGGILLPASFLQSEFFSVLAAFVAINTLLYVTLSAAKILPRVYPRDWWFRVRKPRRRREPRGIYPEAPSDAR